MHSARTYAKVCLIHKSGSMMLGAFPLILLNSLHTSVVLQRNSEEMKRSIFILGSNRLTDFLVLSLLHDGVFAFFTGSKLQTQIVLSEHQRLAARSMTFSPTLVPMHQDFRETRTNGGDHQNNQTQKRFN